MLVDLSKRLNEVKDTVICTQCLNLLSRYNSILKERKYKEPIERTRGNCDIMHKAIYHKLMDRPYPWEQQDQKPTETHKTKIVLIISLKYQISYNGDPKRRE
jgi:hypothetical protein